MSALPSELLDLGKIRAELARRSLSEFSRQAWAVLEPSTPLEWNWHLDAICDHLQAQLEDWMAVMVARTIGLPDPPQRFQNIAINVPPGTGKSRFVSVFTPAWMWLRWPSWKSIFISGNPRVCLRDADYCRILIESDWYQDTFQPTWKLAKDQNAKSLYRNTEGGFRMAFSANAKITGDRADGLFADDPNDAKDSPAKRDLTNQGWDQGIFNRVNDLRCSIRVLIQQRLDEKDLTGHVTADDGWEHLVIAQEFDPSQVKVSAIGWKDPRTETGELMFPARFPTKILDNEKLRLGPYGYAGQHQQRPSPAGGGKFKRTWYRYYRLDESLEYYWLIDGDGRERAVRVDACDRFAVIDPAGTDKNQNEKACYTVIQVWDITPADDMVLVHQWREQRETPDVESEAVAICRRYQVNFLGVEIDGIGLGVIQHIARRWGAVLGIKAKGSKEARCEIAQIRMAGGKVFWPAKAPYLFDLESEVEGFPRTEYKDQVDAFAHAAIHVQHSRGPVTTSKDDEADKFTAERDERAAADDIEEARREAMKAADPDDFDDWDD